MTTHAKTRPAVVIRAPEGPMPATTRRLAPDYDVIWTGSEAEFAARLAGPDATRIAALVPLGHTPVSDSQMAGLPGLRLIHAFGAGYEGVDVVAARRRGIRVTNGSGGNSETVADHAWALLLGLLRAVPAMDALSRQGRRPAPGSVPFAAVHGKRLGIYGPGHIGQGVGRRGTGFGMDIGYVARTERPGLGWQRFADLRDMAEWCDVLVISVPASADTQRRVDAGVLAALGPQGVLVNVARGSVVETGALVQALEQGLIAGAALDVWDDEPALPDRLAAAPNLLLSPHVASVSPEAMATTTAILEANLLAHSRGADLRNIIA